MHSMESKSGSVTRVLTKKAGRAKERVSSVSVCVYLSLSILVNDWVTLCHTISNKPTVPKGAEEVYSYIK